MQETSTYRYYTAWALIFGVLITCWWSSFYGVWIYDDILFILKNKNIALTELTWQGISRTFSGIKGGNLRPLAFLSFGLNHYLSGYDIFSYHLVNFLIHLTGTWFVFHIIDDTLALDRVFCRWPATRRFDAALLGAVLWGTSPLHVYAVTNIWQRVTSLCGMLMIMTLFFYIRARRAKQTRLQWGFGLAALTALGLSLLVKENSVMMPLSIMVYDILFFQKIRPNRLKALGYMAVPVAVVAVAGCFYTDWSWILTGYDLRPFTLGQRLLTESRVLVFYLSLIAYPLASRTGFFHDFPVSHSLIDPWTTAASILFIALITGTALWKSRQYPLCCYAILFFFINHLIESSVIPLDLVNEYRNYVPSIFIYAVIAAGVVQAMIFFEKNRPLSLLIVTAAGVCLVCQGHTVHMANRVMQDPGVFWLDGLTKSPRDSGLYNNFAMAVWNRTKNTEAALKILKQGEKINHYQLKPQQANTWYNMALCYYNCRDYKNALIYFKKALPYKTDDIKFQEKLIHTLMYTGRMKSAQNVICQLMHQIPAAHKIRLQSSMGVIWLKQEKIERARTAAIGVLGQNPGDYTARLVMAEIYRRQNTFEKAAGYIRAILSSGYNPLAQMALITIYYQAKDRDKLYPAAGVLMARLGKKKLSAAIDEINKSARINPFVPDKQIIINAVNFAGTGHLARHGGK